MGMIVILSSESTRADLNSTVKKLGFSMFPCVLIPLVS